MSAIDTEARADKAEQLSPEARAALADLILVLADTKRVLGLRYSDRMLGAPTLEAGIAASSMAQDEWGHGRLTYALLGAFGHEPKALEHDRPGAQYRSMPALDRGFGSWSEMIAASLVLDTAVTVQYGALVGSRYAPAQNRVQKMLDEEGFHFQYAAGWTRRIAPVAAVRGELAAAVAAYLPFALQWLGREDAASTRALVDEGLVREGPDALRARLLRRIGAVLASVGMAEEVGLTGSADGGWTFGGGAEWAGWSDATRRSGGELDEATAARARGDKNRAMLLE
ncbi:MAG TPA: Phenylacetic acid catabolic protein [Longimicrobiaceae bacterium]|jgi:1,2-phenylacetyl-CoA epoxidase catalytic subunit|nr:Phenylacetic acid catabolic protein [Longimicrobiaceae bacterium]